MKNYSVSTYTQHACRSYNDLLGEIRKQPRLTPEEEAQMAVLIEEGDETAVQRLFEASMGFAVTVAKSYAGMSKATIEDLTQEALIALWMAAREYRTGCGKFTSFAAPFLCRSLKTYMAYQGYTLTTPLYILKARFTLKRMGDRFYQEHGYMPTLDEYSEQSDIPAPVVREALQFPVEISLQSTVDDEGDMTFEEVLDNGERADDVIERRWRKVILFGLVQTITSQENANLLVDMLDVHKGLYTVSDIMQEYNLSRKALDMRLSRIHRLIRESDIAQEVEELLAA